MNKKKIKGEKEVHEKLNKKHENCQSNQQSKQHLHSNKIFKRTFISFVIFGFLQHLVGIFPRN